MSAAPFPGVKLGGFYFLFFAGVGAFMPYWTLYLESLGLTAGTIGSLMALLMATRIVGPNLWGWVADHRGRRMGVIRLGAVVATALFAFIPGLGDPLPLAAVLVAYAVFWSAVLPQFEAVTLAHLGTRSDRYSRIRLWGSVGFIIASAAVGPVLDRLGAGLLPWVVLGFMGAITVASFAVREPVKTTGAEEVEAPPAPLDLRSVVMLMLACALMQASHGPYYVFFSIQLESLGFLRVEIGALWAFAVAAEVALFAAMPRLLQRFPLVPLFAVCFVITAIRWVAMAVLPLDLAVLVAVQALHAVSFGAFHAAAIALVHRLFEGGRQGRGQALYSSLSFGAGGAAGSALAGWVWAGAGPDAAWLVAGALAGLGAMVALGVRSAPRE